MRHRQARTFVFLVGGIRRKNFRNQAGNSGSAGIKLSGAAGKRKSTPREQRGFDGFPFELSRIERLGVVLQLDLVDRIGSAPVIIKLHFAEGFAERKSRDDKIVAARPQRNLHAVAVSTCFKTLTSRWFGLGFHGADDDEDIPRSTIIGPVTMDPAAHSARNSIVPRAGAGTSDLDQAVNDIVGGSSQRLQKIARSGGVMVRPPRSVSCRPTDQRFLVH